MHRLDAGAKYLADEGRIEKRQRDATPDSLWYRLGSLFMCVGSHAHCNTYAGEMKRSKLLAASTALMLILTACSSDAGADTTVRFSRSPLPEVGA